MSWFSRLLRHARLSFQACRPRRRQTPPFLIVFVNSICNLTCRHCFYWRNLNRRDDLTFEEFRRLSQELGPIENLNLSGGEPFLRSDFADICTLFIRNNQVRQIYVPTNGYYTDRTEQALRQVLRLPSLSHFVCELSLDGMAEYHDAFRGNPASFARALETYDMLARLQREDSRLRIHAVSTATEENVDELFRLTEFLHQRCPLMEHHSLALIRGDRKDPLLRAPDVARYRALYDHVKAVWADREKGRFGAIVEPMLQWAKARTVAAGRQVVPCTAGNLTGVVYANGDVGVCETHPPLGNLRQKSFFEIWDGPGARALRAHIRDRRCHCTNEVFLWPSIVFQPVQLARALLGRRLWRFGQREDSGRLSLPLLAPREVRP